MARLLRTLGLEEKEETNFRTCHACDKVAQLFQEDYGVDLEMPCHKCISPGASFEYVEPLVRTALEVYQRTSSQLITIGGGLAPSLPVGLDVVAVKIVMDLLGVKSDQQLLVLDLVQELFTLVNSKTLLDPEKIVEDAIAEQRIQRGEPYVLYMTEG